MTKIETSLFSKGAEQSIIGGIMLKNEVFQNINNIIGIDDFYFTEHQIIWEAFQNLVEISEPIDPITVAEELQSKNKFDDIGGGIYLTMLLSNTPSACNVIAYAKIVKEKSLIRQLNYIGEQIKESTNETQGKTSNQLIEQAQQLFDKAHLQEVSEPLPIIPEYQINTNVFPTYALGEYLAPAVKGIQEATMFSETLIAHSALSAIISTTQGIGMVMTNRIHGYMLLSTAFLLIGRSSEGKGQADKFFFSAIREYEKEKRQEYFEQDKEYKRKLRQYEAEIKKELKDENGEDFYPDEPIKPLDPRLITYSPTTQSIIKAFIDGASSITLTAEDGKSFLGGWSMSLERQEATMAILCKLIDSGSGEKEVASELNKLFSDRAFSMSLGLQPVFWQKLLSDKTMLSQGLMSRMLICYPESTIGFRPESDDIDEHKLDKIERKIYNFNNRIKQLISFMYAHCVQEEGNLDRLKYKLSTNSQKKWAKFQREYQEKLRIRDGEYAEQQEMLGKMLLQPVKIATALYIFENLDTNRYIFDKVQDIPSTYIERGIEIVKFYWKETKWLFQEHEISNELSTIDKLGQWLRSNPKTTKGNAIAINNKFKLRDILTRGPVALRKRNKLLQALEELENHNQGRLIKSGRSYIFEVFNNVQSDLL